MLREAQELRSSREPMAASSRAEECFRGASRARLSHVVGKRLVMITEHSTHLEVWQS